MSSDAHDLPSEVRREWIPSDWMDEWVPQMAEDPAIFFKVDADYGLRMVPLEVQDGESTEMNGMIRSLKSGDVVALSWREDRGEGTLVVNADGTWRCNVDFPDDTTHFWLPYDIATLSSSLDELVKGGDAPFEPDPPAAGEHAIAGYTWGEASFRVDLLEGGTVRLTPVEGVV